ncbi:hypothetical protein BBJ28_00022648 [Nothophytophthora sp. Chile5]|nr:hypothetical protein BBJ28_00022648 [Nothophytophthora sp. Chile5]
MPRDDDTEWIEEDASSSGDDDASPPPRRPSRPRNAPDLPLASEEAGDDGCFEANLKSFQKGHTKNACDRGFGQVKQRLSRSSCWSLSSLAQEVENASTAISNVNLDEAEAPFWKFKSFFMEGYKKLSGIQSYQIFRVHRDSPGKVECKRTPSSEPTWQNLQRRANPPPSPTMQTFADSWLSIEKLGDPPKNPEKMFDIHAKILPYVPATFASDPIYQAPSRDVADTAREIKRDRRQRTLQKQKKQKQDHSEDEGKQAQV